MATPQMTSVRPRMGGSGNRLLSLDVLRGLTIAGMILVTDPGTYAPGRFGPLQHAEWDGGTLTDMIFPCFLTITGVSMTLSFAARLDRGEKRTQLALHALRRCVWLIVLGLLVNGFPFYDLAHLRIPGILQRIGICYLISALIYLPLRRQSISRQTRFAVLGSIIFICLVGYWALLKLYPTPGFGPGHLDSLRNLPAVVDRAVFTVPHLWAYGLTPGYGVTYDSEGILSTIPALATVLIGVLAGEVLRTGETRSRQGVVLAAAGTLLWGLGLGLSPWLVLNKRIYTPTFALFSDGLCLLLLAGLLWLIDGRGLRRGWDLLLIFGTNAIFAFVLSSVITAGLSAWRIGDGGQRVGMTSYLYNHLFAAAGLPLHWSSLLYAIAIVLLNAALVYPLYRREIFLKL